MRVAPLSRPRLVLCLLVAGVLLWIAVLWAGYNGSMPIRWISALQLRLLGFATVVLLIGKTRRALFAVMRRVRHPSPRSRYVTAILVSIAAGLYLFATALHQGRDLFPKIHDEHMHLVQMQLLAHGSLWLPAHPHADFFETFHIFNTPVYAPMHFPGASLLYAPAVWLKLPYCLPPLLVASTIVGLIYLLLTELIDGVAGLLGAFMMLGLAPFRYVSLMVLSNPVALLFGLLMLLAWLRWRRSRAIPWAIALGVFCGWAAITRPPDALCFAIPLGIAITLDALQSWTIPSATALDCFRRYCVVSGAIVAGAVPFLALQLIFDHGVTGHWLQTPHDQYSLRYNPGVNYGLSTSAPPVPQTTLPQKQIYYASFVRPFIDMHRPERIAPNLLHLWLPTAVRTTLPAAPLLVFLPVGMLGLVDRRRAAVTAVIALALCFYAFSVMISWYYLLFTAPAVMLCVLLGMRQIELAWPALRPWTAPALLLLIASFTIAALPEARGEAVDQFNAPTIKAVDESLRDIHAPSLVLFTFRHGDNFHEEPVFNVDAANPDDAPIIRAHDLGPRNAELYHYYAASQSDRMVYRFDRRSRTLVRLGNVKDLAAEATASAQAP